MDTPGFQVIGRYALCDEIASGGMATVHLGRLLGPVGFSRTVAIKRLHKQFSADPEFAAMFLDEARLAARLRHPNVVPTLDVVSEAGELFLVMEYVEGESLARLLRACRAANLAVPPRVVSAVMSNALEGLHVAHEATGEHGEALGIVHRDVSPHNIIVGADGFARVLDFGVAKAEGRLQTTRDGQLKGKLSYMPPEQIRSQEVDRRVDVYSATIVLWEALTGHRPFDGGNEAALLHNILYEPLPPTPTLSPEVRAVLARGLARERDERFQSARELEVALESVLPPASPREVAAWVDQLSGEKLKALARRIRDIESSSALRAVIPSSPEDMGSSRRAAPLPSLSLPRPSAPPPPLGLPPLPGARPPSRDHSSSSLVLPPPVIPPEMASRVSQVQVPPVPARGQRAKVAALALVGLAVSFAAGSVLRLPAGDGPTGASSAPSASAPGGPSVAIPSASIEALPIESAAPVASAAASAAVSAAPVTSAAPATSATSGKKKPAVDCSVPWVLDKKGIRRIRPECR